MGIMWLLIAMLALVCYGQAEDYHYPRPQVPFHLSSPEQQLAQQQPGRFIVQTLGPHGRTYELQMHKAPTAYVAHQTYTVQGNQQQQQQHLHHQVPQQQLQLQHHVPQQQQQLQHHVPQQQQQLLHSVSQQRPHLQHHVQQQQQQHQQQYHVHQQQYQAQQQQYQVQPQQQQYQVQPQQQQYQVQQQQQHQVQQPLQPLQQLHATANNNPLLVNTNYQQTSVGLTAPPAPAPPISYYTPAQTQIQTQTHTQSNVQQSADSYYTQPQALTVATATQVQSAGQYLPPQQQQLEQPQQPQHSNPQPYAIVTLPNGQRVQDAGHGSGTPPASVSAQAPRVGDFSAQSQTATLDTYNYKQAVPGDSRGYQRYVTNCQPNGQCKQLILSPGQIDGDHQQLLQAARAQTQAATSSCKKSGQVPRGAQLNALGQLRPLARRSYVHVQEQLAKYPYN